MHTDPDFIVIYDERNTWLLVRQSDLDALHFKPSDLGPRTTRSPNGTIALEGDDSDVYLFDAYLFIATWQASNHRKAVLEPFRFPADTAPCRDWPSYGTSPSQQARLNSILSDDDELEDDFEGDHPDGEGS
jgi:hypothetical protein